MSKKPIVEVKNLKISSNNNYLIRDLSFKVMPNEILGIIGESGSGKSLTALSIIDLIKYKGLKQAGEIMFNPNLIETEKKENSIDRAIKLLGFAHKALESAGAELPRVSPARYAPP